MNTERQIDNGTILEWVRRRNNFVIQCKDGVVFKNSACLRKWRNKSSYRFIFDKDNDGFIYVKRLCGVNTYTHPFVCFKEDDGLVVNEYTVKQVFELLVINGYNW